MYLFCSNCKAIFTFCSILSVFQQKRPYHFEIRALDQFQNFGKCPNRRDGHVPFVHGALAHEDLARQWAALRGGED